MCKTSDKMDDYDKVEEKTGDVAEDDLKYEESKAKEPKGEEEVSNHKKDETYCEESKTGESEAEENVENADLIPRRKKNPSIGWILNRFKAQSGCGTSKCLLLIRENSCLSLRVGIEVGLLTLERSLMSP